VGDMLPANEGLHIFHDKPVGDAATIAVTGLGRSGTTMIARVLSELGLHLGDDLSPMSHEDRAVKRLVKARDWDGFERLCRIRDQEHGKWGFKLPAIRSRLTKFGSRMTNPRFIIPFRDLLALSIRRIDGEDMTAVQLRTTVRDYEKLLDQIELCPCPILVVSYEKALQYPARTVSAIRDFCGLTVPIDAAVEAIENGSPKYRTIPPIRADQ